MKKFYSISKDCTNKKYFEIVDIDKDGNTVIEETTYELVRAYPFEIDEREADKQLITVDGKQYHRRGTYLIPMEYVYEISREEYIQRTLEMECQYDSTIQDRIINGRLKGMSISEFANNLKQAFINRVYDVSINPYSETTYSDFVKYACDSLVNARPHLIYIPEITTKEIQLRLVLDKPGYFIGKCGEVVNFWTNRLNNILKVFNPKYTLSIRIEELIVLDYKESEIIL